MNNLASSPHFDVRPVRLCPDPGCTDADCAGECLDAEPGYRCSWCGATNPFASEPGCHVCRGVRSETARSAESAAGWDATP
jgi:hypothetical protein